MNFKHFVKHLRKVISSLKYDKITLNTLVHNLKFARISFLQPIKCHQFKHLIFLATLRWLVEDFIFELIKASFYATDTSKTNSEIFFYLKSDWSNILNNQLNDQTTKNYKHLYHLEKIREINAIEYCSKFESNGVSLGRLLPKNIKNECRIISGCKMLNPYTKKVFNSNFKFITLNNCLNWLIKNDPSLIGFAFSDQFEMKKKYLNFLNLNTLNRTCSDFKNFHFLKSDIEKCFDSINIDDLISYVDLLFEKYLGDNQVFSIVKYCQIKFDLDQIHLKVKYDHLAVRHSVYEKKFRYGTADLEPIIGERFKSSKTHSIIVPVLIHDKNVNLNKLKNSIRMCLKHVLIKIHNDIFERSDGILQGSICSRNLCDLYFGRIEKELFTYNEDSKSKMKLNQANELIMRIVDDYFIICSDTIRLIKIHNLIKTEFELNEIKTVILFSSKKQVESSSYFSWCGMDFDIHTLDIYFNYDKYFDLENMKTRLNYSNDYRFPFATFNLKFLRLFNNSTNSLIFDNKINSLNAIICNFIDCFALSSVRFSLLYKLMPIQLITNVDLQLKLINNLCYFSLTKIDSNLRIELNEHFYSTLNLLKYICFNVYFVILKKMNNKIYKPLLNLINLKIRKINFSNCFKNSIDIDKNQIDYFLKLQTLKFLNYA